MTAQILPARYVLARLLAGCPSGQFGTDPADPLADIVARVGSANGDGRTSAFQAACAERGDGEAIIREVFSIAPDSEPSEPPQSRFRLWTPDEIDAMPSPTWLASEFLVQGTLSCLYGPTGGGKTFAALDLAFSVASGEHWLGSIPVTQGPVVYVAAEGVGGLKERKRAWQARHPGADLSLLRFVTVAVNLLEMSQINDLVDAIRAQFSEPTLATFDTLARSMAGGDENSAKDMNIVVSAADTVRTAFNCHVQVVHHTGKNGDSERGSSALRAACDTSLYLSSEGGGITLECKKQKDAAAPGSLGLKLVQVDGTGSCVLETFDTTGELTRAARQLLRILGNSFPVDEGASTAKWEKAAENEVQGRSFYRARTILIQNKFVVKIGKRGPNKLTEIGCSDLGIEPSESTPRLTANLLPKTCHDSNQDEENDLLPTATPFRVSGSGSNVVVPGDGPDHFSLDGDEDKLP